MSTHNIPFFNIKKKITLNYLKSAAMGFFQGLKNEFKSAVVDEPSVFEPLKFYCTLLLSRLSVIFLFLPSTKRVLPGSRIT